MDWFSLLNKSALTPPPVVFTVVWTVLYVIIAFSFLLYIFLGLNKNQLPGILLFLFHVALNFIWTLVFFKFQNVAVAFFVIILLILSALALICVFYKVSKLAGMLLVPYLTWLLFAAYLNFEIIRLN